MSLALATELRRMSSDIRRLARGIRRAQLEALDATAMDVKAAEVREIDDSFDRPTPYTRNAIFVQRTRGGVPEARVGLKSDFGAGAGRAPAKYLRAQIEGGSRVPKGFERALRRLLAVANLDPGEGTYLVPGRYARLDAYGNIERGQLVQILSQLRAFGGAESVSRNLPRDGDYERNRSGRTPGQVRKAAYRRAGGQYFAIGRRAGLRPGIYQRQVANRRIAGAPSPRPRPVLIFVDRATYEQRFAFWSAGQYEIERAWPRNFDAALARYAGASA